jgi:hypothetical protein
MSRKGSLLSLWDRDPASSPVATEPKEKAAAPIASNSQTAPSRQGKKAMTGYFSPEMSFTMHMTARKHGMSLQNAMAEAFNDWLRKMGESPVGK